MYRHCIFCNLPLGRNEAIETFPTGRMLAFDPWKGRLWVVCPGCSRWNLTPLEERWEACEEAERAYRDARLRAQTENIGLARLADGTRLVRVGKALEGELAAWRYGGQLVTRRRRYLMASAGAGLVVIAGVSGLTAMGIGSLAASFGTIANTHIDKIRTRKVVHRIPAANHPAGDEIVIRRWHVQGAELGVSEADGSVALSLWDVGRKEKKTDGWGRVKYFDPLPFEVRGDDARVVLSRSMAFVNQQGASSRRVERAIQLLYNAGSVERYIESVAGQRSVVGKRILDQPQGHPTGDERVLDADRRLALEMALNEETERAALQGELAVLESAWRSAEEIAAIADTLPDDPLDRIRGLIGRGGADG